MTKIQATSIEEVVLWETNIDTSVEEYRRVDGINVGHSGRTTATLFRFGEAAMSHTKTRLEEEWVIDEVAFGVLGLSSDLFIPPANIVRIDPHGTPGPIQQATVDGLVVSTGSIFHHVLGEHTVLGPSHPVRLVHLALSSIHQALFTQRIA